MVQRYRPAILLEVVGRVSHDHRMPGKGQHVNVIVIVADGHDFAAIDATVPGPALERMPLGTVGIEQVHDAQVAVIVLGAQRREVVAEAACCQVLLRPIHQLDRPAEHRLDRVLGQPVLDRTDILDERSVLFHPPLNHAIQPVMVLADNGAHAGAIEGQHHVAAIFPQRLRKPDGGLFGQQVAMKGFARGRARDGAIRTHHPQVEAQRPCDGQREVVASARAQHDLDAGLVSAAQCVTILLRKLDLGVQQRAIDINRDEADGARHSVILSTRAHTQADSGGALLRFCHTAPREIRIVTSEKSELLLPSPAT